VSVRGFSYLESTDARYMPAIVERGADALAAAGRFFGHIAYASLVARRPG
jgi:hypothetical protein